MGSFVLITLPTTNASRQNVSHQFNVCLSYRLIFFLYWSVDAKSEYILGNPTSPRLLNLSRAFYTDTIESVGGSSVSGNRTRGSIIRKNEDREKKTKLPLTALSTHFILFRRVQEKFGEQEHWTTFAGSIITLFLSSTFAPAESPRRKPSHLAN